MEAIQLEEGYGENKYLKNKRERSQMIPHECLNLKYKSSACSTQLVYAARDSFHISKAHYHKIKVQFNPEAV